MLGGRPLLNAPHNPNRNLNASLAATVSSSPPPLSTKTLTGSACLKTLGNPPPAATPCGRSFLSRPPFRILLSRCRQRGSSPVPTSSSQPPPYTPSSSIFIFPLAPSSAHFSAKKLRRKPRESLSIFSRGSPESTSTYSSGSNDRDCESATREAVFRAFCIQRRIQVHCLCRFYTYKAGKRVRKSFSLPYLLPKQEKIVRRVASTGTLSPEARSNGSEGCEGAPSRCHNSPLSSSPSLPVLLPVSVHHKQLLSFRSIVSTSVTVAPSRVLECTESLGRVCEGCTQETSSKGQEENNSAERSLLHSLGTPSLELRRKRSDDKKFLESLETVRNTDRGLLETEELRGASAVSDDLTKLSVLGSVRTAVEIPSVRPADDATVRTEVLKDMPSSVTPVRSSEATTARLTSFSPSLSASSASSPVHSHSSPSHLSGSLSTQNFTAGSMFTPHGSGPSSLRFPNLINSNSLGIFSDFYGSGTGSPLLSSPLAASFSPFPPFPLSSSPAPRIALPVRTIAASSPHSSLHPSANPSAHSSVLSSVHSRVPAPVHSSAHPSGVLTGGSLSCGHSSIVRNGYGLSRDHPASSLSSDIRLVHGDRFGMAGGSRLSSALSVSATSQSHLQQPSVLTGTGAFNRGHVGSGLSPAAGGGRALGGTPVGQPTVSGIPLFVMLPLDTVTRDGHIRNLRALSVAFQALKSAGVAGVMVDVWWGVVEREGPGIYDWTAYQTILSMAKRTGLLLQAVMSFHACGGNVGDNTYIPLPKWVRDCAHKDNAIYYTDSAGRTNPECISLFSDNVPCLAGRTPIQAYEDMMYGFRTAMGEDWGNYVREVAIGMGPCGELRYPGYPEGDGRWRFPGIGEFQCYDKRALEDLRAAAVQRGEPRWGLAGPHDAGHYNSKPYHTGFFADEGNWKSEYGKFFLEWYSGNLLQHGERMLQAAVRAFHDMDISAWANTPVNSTWQPPPGSVRLSLKCAGIHWWYRSVSHAAELTAGYYNPRGMNGYEPVVQLCQQYGVDFNFTCCEMRNGHQPPDAHCGPQELLNQVRVTAAQYGVPFAGENALARLDQEAYDQMIHNACSTKVTLYEVVNQQSQVPPPQHPHPSYRQGDSGEEGESRGAKVRGSSPSSIAILPGGGNVSASFSGFPLSLLPSVRPSPPQEATSRSVQSPTGNSERGYPYHKHAVGGGGVRRVDYVVPRMASLTFLRMTSHMFEDQHFPRFVQFVRKLREESTTDLEDESPNEQRELHGRTFSLIIHESERILELRKKREGALDADVDDSGEDSPLGSKNGSDSGGGTEGGGDGSLGGAFHDGPRAVTEICETGDVRVGFTSYRTDGAVNGRRLEIGSALEQDRETDQGLGQDVGLTPCQDGSGFGGSGSGLASSSSTPSLLLPLQHCCASSPSMEGGGIVRGENSLSYSPNSPVMVASNGLDFRQKSDNSLPLLSSTPQEENRFPPYSRFALENSQGSSPYNNTDPYSGTDSSDGERAEGGTTEVSPLSFSVQVEETVEKENRGTEIEQAVSFEIGVASGDGVSCGDEAPSVSSPSLSHSRRPYPSSNPPSLLKFSSQSPREVASAGDSSAANWSVYPDLNSVSLYPRFDHYKFHVTHSNPHFNPVSDSGSTSQRSPTPSLTSCYHSNCRKYPTDNSSPGLDPGLNIHSNSVNGDPRNDLKPIPNLLPDADGSGSTPGPFSGCNSGNSNPPTSSLTSNSSSNSNYTTEYGKSKSFQEYYSRSRTYDPMDQRFQLSPSVTSSSTSAFSAPGISTSGIPSSAFSSLSKSEIPTPAVNTSASAVSGAYSTNSKVPLPPPALGCHVKRVTNGNMLNFSSDYRGSRSARAFDFLDTRPKDSWFL